MRAKRGLALLGAVLVASAFIDGCSNLLGIDGEYGDLGPRQDSSVIPPVDAAGDSRDGSTSDVSVDRDADSAVDVRRDVVADVVSDVRVPCATEAGACVTGLPADWELVLFAPNHDSACPLDFSPTDVISNPSAGAGACECSCTVNSGATCTQGMMATRYGDTDQCESTGLTLNIPNGDCTGISSNIRGFYSSTPLPATIACTASTVTNDANVNSTPMRECSVPNACREEICNGEVPAGFSACVARDGDHACPSGWDMKTLVGDGASLSCSSCTCQASASCSGGRITFYSATGCGTANEVASFDVNDVCQDTGGGGSIRSFRYAATVTNPRCSADGPKTATVDLAGERTVCCK